MLIGRRLKPSSNAVPAVRNFEPRDGAAILTGIKSDQMAVPPVQYFMGCLTTVFLFRFSMVQ